MWDLTPVARGTTLYLLEPAPASVSTYDVITLSIAVAGFGLALLSVGWQAATFFLSGSRVRVSLQRGADGRGQRLLMPADGWGDRQRANAAAQGLTDEVVGIEVRNAGRLAINVDSVAAKFGPKLGMAYMQPDWPGNEALPFRLEPGSSQSWAVPLVPIRAAIAAVGWTESELLMSAGLGNGKIVRTKERTTVAA